MKTDPNISLITVIILALFGALARSEHPNQAVKEKAFDAPHNVDVNVRMEGPSTADVTLQVVCYFKYTPQGAKRMFGAPVELDNRLGGVIGSLRERGDFVGDELETLLIIPPKDSIKAKALLLVGLGDETALSLNLMEAVGRVSLREAVRLGVNRVAFAPCIRDQGDSKIGTGDVEQAVMRGVLLAYDTEKRLQEQRLAKPFDLEQWNVEAGPDFFDDTVKGIEKAIEEAKADVAKRPSSPYASANN